jgi:hypothetical protein
MERVQGVEQRNDLFEVIMPSITHFEIYRPAEPCNLTGEKLREIMDKAINEGLTSDGRELSLKGYCIGVNGVAVLSMDERLNRVKRLNLGGNRIGDEGIKLLTESTVFSKVNWIELGGNDIGPEGVAVLVESKTFSKLKTLNLYRNCIKDKGAKILAERNRLEKLEDLDLAQNEIGDEGLMALANSKNFPNLVAVYIDNNFASYDAREEARDGFNFRKLQSLNL